MKNLIITMLVLMGTTITAQSGEQMNIIKTNVTAYAFRNINLTYERVITKRISVSAGFGMMTKGSIPFASAYIADTEFSETEVGLNHFTIEPRFYLGSGYGHGFYLAPYYRNSSFQVDKAVYNAEFTSGNVPITIAGKAKGNSVGLMLGSQWFMGSQDNWVIDFWILGAHYGKGSGDFRGVSSRPLTADEQQQLHADLDNLEIPMVQFKTTTDSNGATMVLDGPWAGLRSGLSVGYRF